MRPWPPYDPDESDPIPDLEFDQLLAVHGLAVGPYASIAAVQGELAELGALREAYRRSRWVITASRIVAMATSWQVRLVRGWRNSVRAEAGETLCAPRLTARVQPWQPWITPDADRRLSYQRNRQLDGPTRRTDR